MEITEAHPDEIVVGKRLRALNREVVDRLKESISRIGLKTPISVRYLSDEEGWELVTGLHRLQACIELGWSYVPIREEEGTERDARMWEIAENLHRAELTVLERSEQVAEWIRLCEESEEVSGQVDQKLPQTGVGQGVGGGRPKGGISAAARDLGVGRKEAERAVKIASLAPEVKQEAEALHLDNNQQALLNAAQASNTEAQIRSLQERAAKHAAKSAKVVSASASEKRVRNVIFQILECSRDETLTIQDWLNRHCEEMLGREGTP